MDCLFCRIISGEIPCHKVYEDDNLLAFLDIAPISPGHILVLHKNHAARLGDMSEPSLAALAIGVRKVAEAMKTALAVPAYNIMQNNGREAGQMVDHVHFHIIPRQSGDGLHHWAQGKYADGEGEALAAKIVVQLN